MLLNKKILSIILVLVLLAGINYTKVFALNNDNYQIKHEAFIEKIKNVNSKHSDGILLHTESKIIQENGKIYRVEERGKPIKARINIKDGRIEGFIKCDNKKYMLEGILDEKNEKYIGNVVNYTGYTFEVFITDEEKGYLLINIFDDNKNPSSYLISDKKPMTVKTQVLSRNNEYEASEDLYSIQADYYDDLLTVSTRGIYYRVQGPISINTGTWFHKINIRTYADDAWEDSGIGDLMRYAAFVIKNDIKFHPKNSDVEVVKETPNSNQTTNFSFPFYFPIIGLVTVPVTTSTTNVSDVGDVIYSFTWSPLVAYLDEADSAYYSGKKSFGGRIMWSVTEKGYKYTDVYVYLKYEVIAKKWEGGNNLYAYPSYSNTATYIVKVY
ncbi:hypothetical protein VTU32_00080 [Thermoanaerobacter sp. CM-CNRG TB177]|jgi:hypothetical protein|uniref:Uncharacterized protein n=1 Tax=Thermoanaerobacter italicus (strain DSM 9252 / Ab9) TaxID=580331 RepID=D3T7W6_THEIA|nr:MULTISPECIES: hypothetical protein [Thermoanaerobacter]ADD02048.1 hypothetical protein Thit_0767 [Thermoanaerobacter italicus Ab9]MBT1278302.1 hypothetical protein [Thermoanaerobacter sp. CM-CNRG TB177]